MFNKVKKSNYVSDENLNNIGKFNHFNNES